jgi:hypothetical protein
MKIKVLIILLSFFSSVAFGGDIYSDNELKNNPDVTVPCFTVRGESL